MTFKKIILCIVSIFIILIFFKTEFYSEWLDRKIYPIYDNMDQDMDHMDLKERREKRFGLTYYVAEETDTILKMQNAKDPIILLPPNKYIKQDLHFMDFLIVEPSLFYYYVGRKSVWATSADVQKANWAIVAEKTRATLPRYNPDKQPIFLLYEDKNICIALVQITSKQQLDMILSFYKDFNADDL